MQGLRLLEGSGAVIAVIAVIRWCTTCFKAMLADCV